MDNILFTIAARKGSKGIKSKNLIELDGKSLIQRAIELAQSTGISDYIVVSTDCDEIQKIANENIVTSWFKRSSKLSGDNVPKVSVIKDALNQAELHFDKSFQTVIDLDVTAPLTVIEDILGALKLFKKNKYDFVTTGCESRKNPYFNMVEVQKNTIRLVNELNDPIFSRQKAPKIYDLNASVYIYSRDFLLSDKKMFSENQGLYVMPQERSCDIDTLEDLEFVKYKLKKVSNKNIVVVGGNGLIGSSVVSSLKNENKVFNIDITNQNKHEYLDEVYKYKGDVLEIDSIKKIFSDIEKDHGGIHAVVNCTHFKRISRGKDHSSISESEFNESTQQLLTSVFLISQLSINHFLRNGGGNLINLGSIQGVQISKFWHYEGTDMSSPLEYSIAKSSIITMTRYLAKFHKGKNIRINCISPGGILDNQPKEFLEKYRMSTTNIGMLNPSDVSNAIKWLVSDQSRAVNGQNIIVDDGWSL